jgi:hypothetical protein
VQDLHHLLHRLQGIGVVDVDDVVAGRDLFPEPILGGVAAEAGEDDGRPAGVGLDEELRLRRDPRLVAVREIGPGPSPHEYRGGGAVDHGIPHGRQVRVLRDGGVRILEELRHAVARHLAPGRGGGDQVLHPRGMPVDQGVILDGAGEEDGPEAQHPCIEGGVLGGGAAGNQYFRFAHVLLHDPAVSGNRCSAMSGKMIAYF